MSFSERLKKFGSAATLGVTGLVAGCSSELEEHAKKVALTQQGALVDVNKGYNTIPVAVLTLYSDNSDNLEAITPQAMAKAFGHEVPQNLSDDTVLGYYLGDGTEGGSRITLPVTPATLDKFIVLLGEMVQNEKIAVKPVISR